MIKNKTDLKKEMSLVESNCSTVQVEFNRDDLKKLYIPGKLVQVFSNEFGELWVCYLDFKNGDLFLSGSDVDWEWKKIPFSHYSRPQFGMPWLMDEPEKNWLLIIMKAGHAIVKSLGETA